MMRRIVFAILLTAGLAAAAHAEVAPPKNPNSAKGCAICHYRWIDTFFVEGKGTPLVPYQSKKVVASSDMCFSCHDGSVKDSRFRMTPGTGHKVNQVPPSHMEIPKTFPLDEKGRVQCATCHTAHGVPSGPDKEDTIFMRTSNRDSAMCRSCHPDADGGMAKGNHPIGELKGTVPTRLTTGDTRKGAKRARMTCEACHTAHGSPFSGMLVANGGDSGLCLACHTDKAIFDAQGNRKPYHAINVAPQKARIPDALFKKGAKLGDGNVITCQTCHKVHQNKNGPRLLLMEAGKSEFCFTCHSDKRRIMSGKHNLARSAPKEKNLQKETTAQAGVCSACHLTHKPARKLSGRKDFTSQLCLSCHSKGKVASNIELTGNNHPLAVRPVQDQAGPGSFAATSVDPDRLKLPLFNKYGVQDMRSGLMTCATCHNPHGGGAEAARASGSKGHAFFLRESSPQICAQCHDDKFSVARSKHNLAESAPDATNLSGKRPSEAGLCGSCHLVHGSHKGFLWARKDQAQSDEEAFAKGMCLNCHRKGGIGEEKISRGYSHPLGVAPSESGISTQLPLYDDRARRSKTGVIRCATCHDPHRSTQTPADIPPAGKDRQNLNHRFLRLDFSPSPKLCVNCHKDAALLEKTDHDLTITAPTVRNQQDRTAGESGPCSACHLVHNSKNQVMLWARELGEGEHIIEQMCTGCHSADGPAPQKVPSIASHPKSDIVTLGRNQKSSPNYFPVFSPASLAPVAIGNISCLSCHNPHRWRSGSAEKGSGVNVEGDVSSSFLRNPSLSLPCKECHGPEAIYKYSFFHDADKRSIKKKQ